MLRSSNPPERESIAIGASPYPFLIFFTSFLKTNWKFMGIERLTMMLITKMSIVAPQAQEYTI
jgi:hypothetical protein